LDIGAVGWVGEDQVSQEEQGHEDPDDSDLIADDFPKIFNLGYRNGRGDMG
jgi:hypothetical protein